MPDAPATIATLPTAVAPPPPPPAAPAPLPAAQPSIIGTVVPGSIEQTLAKYNVVRVQDLRPGVMMGIGAPGGVGKSTLLGTLLDAKHPELCLPLLIADRNGNDHVIRSNDHIYVSPILNCDMVMTQDCKAGLVIDLATSLTGIKSFALDNMSALYDLKLLELQEGIGQGVSRPVLDGRQAYNLCNQWVINLHRRLDDMSKNPSRRLNVFWIFQEVQEMRIIEEPTTGTINYGTATDPKTGLVQVVPKDLRKEINLSNKMQCDFPSMVPFMGFLRVGSNYPPYPRILDFREVNWSTGKIQVTDNPRLKEIPREVWNPSLGTFIDVLQGEEPWPVAAHGMPSIGAIKK